MVLPSRNAPKVLWRARSKGRCKVHVRCSATAAFGLGHVAGAGDVIVRHRTTLRFHSILSTLTFLVAADSLIAIRILRFQRKLSKQLLHSNNRPNSKSAIWRVTGLDTRRQDEFPNTASTAKWWTFEFRGDAINTAERGPHAALLQAPLQVSTDGLRDGHMGDHELDNSTEEGVQANILSCMAVHLIPALF